MNWLKEYRLVQIVGNVLLFLLLCWLGYHTASETADDSANTVMWVIVMLHLFLVLEKKLNRSRVQKAAWSYVNDTYTLRHKPLDYVIVGPVVGNGAKGVALTEVYDVSVTDHKTAYLAKVDVWRSLFSNPKVELGDYSLSYLVLAVKLDTPTPHIFIDGRSQNWFGRKKTDLWSLTKRLSRREKIADLEGDFYKYFDVYAADKKYLSALTIVTPDVMLALKEQGHSFDYEIHDGHLYVIHEANLSSKDEMQALITAMQNCLDELVPQITKHSYHDSDKELVVSSASLHFWAVALSTMLIIKYFIKVAIFVIAGFAIGEYIRNI